MTAPSTEALKPESSNSYEAGLKTRALQERLQLNIALFLTVFDNYQASSPDLVNGTLVTRLINAGTVSTRGVEWEFALHPLENLVLDGAGAWTRARVDNFNCPPQAPASCDISGQPLPFAPDWKLNTTVSYTIAVGPAQRLVLGSGYHWQSSTQFQLTQTPDTVQGPYGIWDASVALSDDLRGWTLRALVKNITGRNYSEYLAHGDLAGVVRWAPRDARRYAGIEILQTFGR
jgi:iron complex outermembrane receptor protein